MPLELKKFTVPGLNLAFPGILMNLNRAGKSLPRQPLAVMSSNTDAQSDAQCLDSARIETRLISQTQSRCPGLPIEELKSLTRRLTTLPWHTNQSGDRGVNNHGVLVPLPPPATP